MLPIGIASAGFVLISLEWIREAIRGYGVAAVSPSDFEYAGEAASIAGWLLLAIAAILSTGRVSPVRAPATRDLLRGAAIASVGLAIAAALNLTESTLILQQQTHSFRVDHSLTSLVRSLYRSSDGVGVAAWLSATVGAATSLTRVRRESELARARFTVPLFVVLTAAAAQTIASAITFVFDWIP